MKKLTAQLESFYTQFVKKAAEARGKTPEQIDAIAQGRVWTGRQASENGLVDALGGLDKAHRHRQGKGEHRCRRRRAAGGVSGAEDVL